MRTRRGVLRGAAGVALLAGCLEGASSDGPFGGWLSDVDNFDGVVDRSDRSTVTVAVGAEGNGGYYAFGPAAVRISTGTSVVWEWTGRGQSHNVVAESGAEFRSDYSTSEGYTFERTFEAPATVTYSCEPHRMRGMKGAVEVIE